MLIHSKRGKELFNSKLKQQGPYKKTKKQQIISIICCFFSFIALFNGKYALF